MRSKKILILLLNLIAFAAFGQQELNQFHIVDAESQKAVPFVSVTILRARLSITTEKDGIFIIPGNIIAMRDTIVFHAQNYDPVKIPLSTLALSNNIMLSKAKFDASVPVQKYKNDTVINEVDKLDIDHYAGVDTETSNFDYLQLAQQFEAPVPGSRLKRVKIYRLAFNDWGNGHQRTTYRLRFYAIDPVTNGPGKDLTKDIIEVGDGEAVQNGLSLSKYNIVIPQKTFFVAVEWVRRTANAGYSSVYDPGKKMIVTHDNYRPAIGIAPKTGKKLNIWALNFKRQWAPYTYFMPFGTDLAIRATVEY